MGFDDVIDAGVKKVTTIWKDGAEAHPFLGLDGKEELWKERSCRELSLPARKWQKWKDERG